jgi:hypothetical protein
MNWKGCGRFLHSKDLRALHNLSDRYVIVKTNTLGWAGHVGRRGETRRKYSILVGKPLDSGRAEHREVDARITLRLISVKRHSYDTALYCVVYKRRSLTSQKYPPELYMAKWLSHKKLQEY